MPSVKTQFSVGLFVVAGMAVVVLFIIWLGLMQHFHEGRKYTAFFDESVQGLKKDSSVKYRGVDIGRVNSIRVAPDGRLIQITLDLREPLQNPSEIYARIKSVGITGIMFVEMERIPEGESIQPPELNFEPKHPVIATRPSEMKQLFTDLYDIIDEIRKVDFKRIADNVSGTLDNINKTLADARVGQISKRIQGSLTAAEELMAPEKWRPIRKNIRQASRDINQLIAKTDSSVDSATRSLSEKSREMSESMKKFRDAVDNANQLIDSGCDLVNNTNRQMEQMQQQIHNSLQHLESVSINLNRLIEDLANQPSRLFFSQPQPPAKAVEQKGQ
ncbi:MAG: MlaD family protein [Desulfosalsimonadaceae bacterium]